MSKDVHLITVRFPRAGIMDLHGWATLLGVPLADMVKHFTNGGVHWEHDNPTGATIPDGWVERYRARAKVASTTSTSGMVSFWAERDHDARVVFTIGEGEAYCGGLRDEISCS